MSGLTAAQRIGLESTEEAIIRLGLTAPRVTPADIKAAIMSVVYLNAYEAATACGAPGAPDGLKLLTLAIATLRNGFTVVGKSACASAANYDRELGERIAREDAERQLWPLLGYALRESIERGKFNPNGSVVPQ